MIGVDPIGNKDIICGRLHLLIDMVGRRAEVDTRTAEF